MQGRLLPIEVGLRRMLRYICHKSPDLSGGLNGIGRLSRHEGVGSAGYGPKCVNSLAFTGFMRAKAR